MAQAVLGPLLGVPMARFAIGHRYQQQRVFATVEATQQPAAGENFIVRVRRDHNQTLARWAQLCRGDPRGAGQVG
ncbi:hypothetical protein D3C77_569120 [compost metagenome]